MPETHHTHDLTAKQELFQTVTEAGKCPLCGEPILETDKTGGYLIKSRVNKLQGNLFLAKCKNKKCQQFINISYSMFKGIVVPVIFNNKRYNCKIR